MLPIKVASKERGASLDALGLEGVEAQVFLVGSGLRWSTPWPRPERVGLRRGGGGAAETWAGGSDLGGALAGEVGTVEEEGGSDPKIRGGSLVSDEGSGLGGNFGGKCFATSLGRTEGTSLVSGSRGAW